MMVRPEDWVTASNVKVGTVALAIFIVVAYTFSHRNQKKKRLPPSPFSLPIVGSLPFLGRDVREGIRQLTGKFGDVVTVRLGSRESVFLNSHEAIKEAFVKHGNAFAGRPKDEFLLQFITEGVGVVGTQGDQWRQQRKLTHAILREFGVGKSLLEDKIREEMPFFLDEISQNCGTPYDPRYVIQIAVANIICSIIFGARSDYNDSQFKRYIQTLNDIFGLVGEGAGITTFPWLRHIPGDLFHFRELTRKSQYLREHYRSQIEEHKSKFDPNNVSDFIDAYLKMLSEGTWDESEAVFTEKQLVGVISDLFVAGTETTATTLRWAIVFLVNHPEVQVKVQQEIDDVIGKARLPQMQDKSKMPYTEACLLEIQRLGDIVPFSIPHSTLEEVHFRDYILPEGTMVFANLYSVHHDPKTWERPFEFDPTHFLDKDGKVYRKEQLIPFSMGKRVCLGESLARMELFLIFTSMLQRFSFSAADGEPSPSMEGIIGATHMPKPFKVTVNQI